ncbi:MAG: alpha/beta hydrolase [Lachnospiraceae bacterium]|nr:alpha/beta hydrolase [Lachnospiraceae bacterium]
MEKKRIVKRRVLLILLILLIVAGLGSWQYLNEYYEAQAAAIDTEKALVESGDLYESKADGENLILEADGETDTGIIFYPGGKVEYTAYLPLLEKLREAGYDVVLIKMPFNLAFFDMNAGEKVLADMEEELPNVKKWYVMGHSLGGVAASSFASHYEDEIQGLVLLGAYDYGEYDEDNTLIIYGSEDIQLDLSKIDEEKSDVLEIQGGNHAWFGNYGKQDGDGEATISREEQQTIAADKIISWIQSH